MKGKKRLYIYKFRSARYKKGYTWLLRVVAPAVNGKQVPVILKTNNDLDTLIEFRNLQLKNLYPSLWKKVLRHENRAPTPPPPPPKVAYNYNLLPIGSSPLQAKEK